MLYTKKSDSKLSDKLFENPTSEFRSAPFWAWNCKLDKNELLSQIEDFKKMGYGGFHMHSRAGMGTEYLGEEFMDCVSSCIRKAKSEDMLAYLYDEDRWPSGFGGGLVTKNPRFRQRFIEFTTRLCECTDKETAISEGGSYLVACFDVLTDGNGKLIKYRVIGKDEPCNGEKWYAVSSCPALTPRYNDYCYVDVLSKDAIGEFIRATHERYAEAEGEEFGSTVPTMFTDEPQFFRIHPFEHGTNLENASLPWTGDFAETFTDEYGYDIISKLPDVVWDGDLSVRYDFINHLTERFASAFADTLGEWCDNHKIALTGHMNAEDSLYDQASYTGESMRHYRSFGIPGIDVLCNWRLYTTALQARSASHHFGREGVMSELYGVTGWTFDFKDHLFQGNWQAALGITLRVPHLSWVSMEGTAKRDYPASFSYHSPWFEDYKIIEDHFARINTAMTRGKPEVKIGMIHPIESMWLHMGPKCRNSDETEVMEQKFRDITLFMLENKLDFDFINESFEGIEATENGLKVGKMLYNAVVVPPVETLRSSTLDVLSEFILKGGKVIFTGSCPKLCDGRPSDKPADVYKRAVVADFDKTALGYALSEERTVDILESNGKRAGNYGYNLRCDGDDKWLFVAPLEKENLGIFDRDFHKLYHLEIRVKGNFYPLVYDTFTGKICKTESQHDNETTIFKAKLYANDSLLVRLCSESEDYPEMPETSENFSHQKTVTECVEYELSEPNAYLLDKAEYEISGEWKPETDLMFVNREVRRLAGYSENSDESQPWLYTETERKYIKLRFRIYSDIDYCGAYLAAEQTEHLKGRLNGEDIMFNPTGYFVDKAIKTTPLPLIKKGENLLELEVPYGTRTTLEWMYIIGEFGVKVEGCKKTIIKLPEKLGFDSITTQGLPFYSGNITYKTQITTNGNAVKIAVNHYSGAAVKVFADGRFSGYIINPPYQLIIPDLPAGEHEIRLQLLGNRENAFGAIHCSEKSWYNSGCWTKQGPTRCENYLLSPVGITSCPIIYS